MSTTLYFPKLKLFARS